MPVDETSDSPFFPREPSHPETAATSKLAHHQLPPAFRSPNDHRPGAGQDLQVASRLDTRCRRPQQTQLLLRLASTSRCPANQPSQTDPKRPRCSSPLPVVCFTPVVCEPVCVGGKEAASVGRATAAPRRRPAERASTTAADAEQLICICFLLRAAATAASLFLCTRLLL